MAKGDANWLKQALAEHKPGTLHRALHVPLGEKIPLSKLKAAAHRTDAAGHRAMLALTMRALGRGKK